jgi:hypothetical protein
MNAYNIFFKDNTSIQVDEQQGEIVKKAWGDGKKQIPFEFSGDMYLIGDIKRITRGYKDTVKNTVVTDAPRLEGRSCFGRKSIQLEISKRIKLEAGRDWLEPMRDKDIRNTVRLEILDDGEEWCDEVAGTCVCDKINSTITKWSDVF